MPWKMVYEPAPKDLSLPVLQELPCHVTEEPRSLSDVREASGIVDEQFLLFHYCRHCKGWIPGSVNTFSVNTLDSRHLAGRSGTEYHCRRCGEQIGFLGMMS